VALYMQPVRVYRVSCLLLQVGALGLAGFVYPSSGLLPWQELGRQTSRTEGSYPRQLACQIGQRQHHDVVPSLEVFSRLFVESPKRQDRVHIGIYCEHGILGCNVHHWRCFSVNVSSQVARSRRSLAHS
jgi:hypothetical protein